MEETKLLPTEVGDILESDSTLLSNSTFDMKALDETMRIASLRSYWNLYKLQLDKVGLERHVLHFADDFIYESRMPGQLGIVTYPKQHVHYFNYQMIDAGKEEMFRRSELYGKLLSMKDISQNASLFSHNFLIFVGKELITTAELYPLGDKIRISIDVSTEEHSDGVSQETYNAWLKDNVEVVVLLVPNYLIGIDDVSVQALTNGNYIVPSTKVKNIHKVIQSLDGVLVSMKGLSLYTGGTDKSLVTGLYGNELVTALEDNTYQVNVKVPEKYRETTMRLVTIAWEHGFGAGPITNAKSKTFLMENGYPVPTENFLMFARTSGDAANNVLGSIVSTPETKLYYPNIYQLPKHWFVDENDKLTQNKEIISFVFYNELTDTENTDYKSDLEFYYSRVDDLTDRIEAGTMEPLATAYSPETFHYDGPGEYDTSIWYPNITNYKFAKLRAFIERNPRILELYWDVKGSPAEKFYIDCAKLKLSDRIRKDNKTEIALDIISKSSIVFPSDHYVISLKREFLDENEFAFRMWIDGELLLDTEYTLCRGHSFYYIYIPTTLMNEESLIEVERYRLISDVHHGHTDETSPTLTVDENGKLMGETEFLYRVPDGRNIQACDIFVVDEDTGEYLEYDSQYHVEHEVTYNGVTTWRPFPMDSAYVVDGKTVKIKMRSWSEYDETNDEVIFHYVPLNFIYGVYEAAYMQSSLPYDPLRENPTLIGNQMPYVKLDVPNTGNYKKSSYRMFINKRACSTGQFYLRQADLYGEVDSVRTITNLQKGDTLTLDRVPGNYNLVLFMDEVGENGYIDLDGRIPLPLSFKYYDIYLNGLRLNRKTVDFVSPTKMYVHDVHSRRNLMIYQRNHDDDVFYLTSFAFKDGGWSKAIMDELLTLSYAVRTELDSFYPIIIDSERNILEGGQYSEIAILGIVVFEEILKFTFFNPNDPESSDMKLKTIRKLYPKFYEWGVFEISGNNRPEADLILEVNANAEIEKMLQREEEDKNEVQNRT